MENNNELSQVEILKKALEEECLGYPRFKESIVSNLVKVHKVDEETARKYVFSSQVQERIHSDMEWAQHMGSQFWAEEIAEYYMKKDL